MGYRRHKKHKLTAQGLTPASAGACPLALGQDGGGAGNFKDRIHATGGQHFGSVHHDCQRTVGGGDQSTRQ